MQLMASSALTKPKMGLKTWADESTVGMMETKKTLKMKQNRHAQPANPWDTSSTYAPVEEKNAPPYFLI
jgi:hypothetical protein